MTDREALLAAVAADPRDDAPRLVLADWLDEQGEPERAAFIRVQCAAARLRPGHHRRLELLRCGDDLLCEHERAWLGEWADRLLGWEFERGFLRSVQLTGDAFLQHGPALFRTEPVECVEVVNEAGGPLSEEAVRAVVASPAFGFVRECVVVLERFQDRRGRTLEAWLRALADATHVTRLRALGPSGRVDYPQRIDERAVAAFCRAPHLGTLTALNLSGYPTGPRPRRDRLAGLIAEAPFARRLRKLALARCRLTEHGVHRIATDSVFRGLRTLDLSHNTQSAAAWQALFQSDTLARVSDLTLTADHLPEYAGSPMAGRVRGLTVCPWQLRRPLAGPTQEAWLRLIGSARPPSRLALSWYNPSREVFDAMRERGWLRAAHTLALRGDSQSDVYGGRTAGVRRLLRSGALPRLGRLRLHEVADAKVLAALGDWPGLPRLEELRLTDDYFGRLRPGAFAPARPLSGLRQLDGVTIQTDGDVQAFLGFAGQGRLRHLGLSFVGESAGDGRVRQLTRAAATQLLRSAALARLESLALVFYGFPDLVDHVLQAFTNPDLMPRLRALAAGGYSEPPPVVQRLRSRFGARLKAW